MHALRTLRAQGASSAGRDREGAEDNAFMSTSILNEIKGILDQYPDGYTILNELLQNADDAGATVRRVTHA